MTKSSADLYGVWLISTPGHNVLWNNGYVTFFLIILNNEAEDQGASSNVAPDGSQFIRRRTYPPVTKAKFVRDVVANDYLRSPAKKPRAEHYYAERMQPVKQVYKVAEPRPVKPVHTPTVIDKNPVLYAKPFDEWDDSPPPKPKRVRVRPRRKPNLQQESTTDTSTKPVENIDTQETEKAVPASDAADAESVKTDNKPTAEPNQEGFYELNNIMASTLQDELKQIMVKVQQELPDDPPTEAEQSVANKFRNQAGDDLQNAMGLNVTARLLNVHNPLYAKLEFSGKPEAGCLQAFINKYKITAFKRIADSNRDIFAARFDHVADFDKLCVHTEVKCGSATVKIIPCYKYFKIPPTLKSIYADNMVKNRNISLTNSTKANTHKTESVENVAVKTDNAKVVAKKTTEKDSVAKPSNTTPTKSTITENSKMPEKTVAVKAPAPEKAKQIVPEKPKPAVKETPKDVPVVTKKVTLQKVENKDKKNDINMKNDKQVKLDKIDDMMVVDEEVGEEDDEEMTDQDILALMSGGIVLDECSGSDDDK